MIAKRYALQFDCLFRVGKISYENDFKIVASLSIMRGEKMMKLKIILEPSDDGGYSVTIPSLPVCIGEGDTREKALRRDGWCKAF